MLYTGARGCDARQFGSHFVEDDWLRFHQQKLIDNPRGWVELALHDELVKELALVPGDQLAFVLNQHGKPYSQKGFSQWFSGVCDKASLPHCTAHGSSKAAATIAADNGATVHQLMATFGWMTEQQAIHYTQEANRKRLAAGTIGLIKVEQNGTAAEQNSSESVPPCLRESARWDKAAKSGSKIKAKGALFLALPRGIEPRFQP